jgi:hypothetical protein
MQKTLPGSPVALDRSFLDFPVFGFIVQELRDLNTNYNIIMTLL